MGRWFSVHSHSNYSALDGTTDIKLIVARAKEYGYPALGLSDHGNLAGATRFYLECQDVGIKPFIGCEMYLIDPDHTDLENSGGVKRFHLGLYARNEAGYKALVKIVSKSHTRPRFNRFPRIVWEDLIELSEENADDIILLTGCFFGLVQQTLVDHGREPAKSLIEAYAALFPHTFVELQQHNIDHTKQADSNPNIKYKHDLEIMETLADIALELDLPVMSTQDFHYLDVKDRAAHGLMKKMVYSSAEDGFPGDSFHMASEDWVEDHYPEDTWKRCLEGADRFLDLHDLQLDPLDKFVARVPSVDGVDDADVHIEQVCRARLMQLTSGLSVAKLNTYLLRLKHELDVIKTLGMAGYFAIVEDYVQWCRQEGICVEARGSANGSLVCYLMRITSIDPVAWGLMFERFLSLDRTKPPDIDMDVESIHRQRLVEYLLAKYNAYRISTFGKIGESIDQETGERKGSILVSYKSYLTRGITDKDEKDKIFKANQTLDDVKRNYPDDYEGLARLVGMGSVYKSYGVHAGGVLLPGDNFDVEEWVPTMLVASSNTTVTQFTMHDVEEWGLLKLDILGQATLTVMKLCQEYIGRQDPTDFSWIPNDDKDACKILREGRTNNGIFHMEGYTKAKGGKEMQIKSTKDSVIATALYMPGAKSSGQTELFLKRRFSQEERAKITYIHPIWQKHLAQTYGAVVFQEQVMSIMRDLGMGIGSVNAMLKILKTSGKDAVHNNARLQQLKAEFDDCCQQHGVDPTEAWESISGIVSYAFNECHAAGYGVRSYRCAYLKAHHPVEFMAALLSVWAGRDKETLYIREARHMQIRIGAPDVNESDTTWTLSKNKKSIRKGLLSLKGIGEKAAYEIANKKPFKDIDHMIRKVSTRALSGGKKYQIEGEWTGTLGVLKQAGALRSLGIGPEGE